jgi:cytochrome c-type biogenesis protein CcmH
LVLVAVVVLVVGTHRSSHPSLQDKTMHVASLVRCPVCEGQSAAESQAPASVQIRDQIRQELSAGESQAQIVSGLVAAYGPGILEKPEARGVGLLLWVLPVLAVVAAIAGLALAFARWRPRRSGAGVTPADRELVDQALRRDSASAEGQDGKQGGPDPGVASADRVLVDQALREYPSLGVAGYGGTSGSAAGDHVDGRGGAGGRVEAGSDRDAGAGGDDA